jgi:hypothetical protein
MTDTNDEITEVFDRLSHHGVKEARLEFEIKGDHSIDLDSKFHLKDGGSIEMEEKDGVLSCVMDSIVLCFLTSTMITFPAPCRSTL